MSESIKPWGYIHPEIENILRDKAVSNTCITKKRAGYNTMPLYTAEQLAEAVEAERERCAKVYEAIGATRGEESAYILKKASTYIRSSLK